MAAVIPAPVITPSATSPSVTETVLTASDTLETYAVAIAALADQTVALTIADAVILVRGIKSVLSCGIKDGNHIRTGTAAATVARNLAALGEVP